MKKIIYLSALISCVFTSCMKDDALVVNPQINAIDNSDWNKINTDALTAFSNAYNDFYSGIPSGYDTKRLTAKEILQTVPAPPAGVDSVSWTPVFIDTVKMSELAPNKMGLKEKVQAVAMEAQMTGDDTKLIEFLKANGLYEKYTAALAKYEVAKHAKSLSRKKKSIDVKSFSSENFIDGDIYLKYDNSSVSNGSSGGSSGGSSSGGSGNIFNWLIPGKWGHAAFMDTRKRLERGNHYLLSASNETDQDNNGASGRVGYDKIVGYWTDASEVAVSRVNGASPEQRRAAVEYSKQFIGSAWVPTLSRYSDDQFYCSKVVYRGWLSQGYELEPHKDSSTGLPWVSYPEFAGWATVRVNRWFAYSYPTFRTVEIKDSWVTPTDLDQNNYVSRIATY